MNTTDAQNASEYHWHAIYTCPRSEKKVHKILEENGIEVYLPLQKRLRQWKDRKKWVEEPLFRSYLFVKVSEKEYYSAINVQGAVRYITFAGKAVKIPERQILSIRQLMESQYNITVTTSQFKKGDIILIKNGVLVGLEGEMISYLGKKRILMRIQQLSCSLIVEVPLTDLAE